MKDKKDGKATGRKLYRSKGFGLLYSIVFALVLSGCSLSGMADGNKSAVKGYSITTEAVTETDNDSLDYLSDQESTTDESAVDQTDEKKDEETEKAADPENTKAKKIQSEIENHSDKKESPDGKENSDRKESSGREENYRVDLADIPAYSGAAYCEINGNVPGFADDELTTDAFEDYSELDSLGRCGVAYANICKEIMPTEKRGEIGMVKPSGWHTVKYNDRIDGNYLYNRCHLIGYQLAGENANVKNLITGTRYLNVTGMLPFENEVADYVESTDNHVLYRVTPIFDGDNLVASGVQMEAESVEDKGAGVCFNVYVYNVQPGVIIDYATGDSEADPDYTVYDNGEASNQASDQSLPTEATYIVNINTGKFHRPDCSSVKRMKESNKAERTTTRDELISEGYEPCKNCNP